MKASYCEYLREKYQKTKLNQLMYDMFQIQPYQTIYGFTKKKICILYSLRFRFHPAKSKYKKMYNNTLHCSIGCLAE